MSDILIWFIIGIIAGAIGVALDTHRKKRLGIKDEPKAKPNESAKSRWPTDEMYKNFYRTGDRRFLYDEHYKKKGYNDFDDDDDDYDDYDDKHKERRTKHYSQSWVSDENYEKFLRTGDRNYLWDENYKRWDDYDDDDYDDLDDDDDREYEKVRKDVKEFLEKDTPKLILP